MSSPSAKARSRRSAIDVMARCQSSRAGFSVGKASGHKFGPCNRRQRGSLSLSNSAGRSAPISNCSRQSGWPRVISDAARL